MTFLIDLLFLVPPLQAKRNFLFELYAMQNDFLRWSVLNPQDYEALNMRHIYGDEEVVVAEEDKKHLARGCGDGGANGDASGSGQR